MLRSSTGQPGSRGGADINSKENFEWVRKGDEKKIKPFSEEWYSKYPKGLSEMAVLCMKKVGFR